MMKEKILTITLIIWTAVFGLAQKTDAKGKEALDLIPRGAMAVSSLSKIMTDPGLSFLMELEREKLMREEKEADKKAIKKIYQLDILEVVAVLFPLNEKGISRYIMVIEFPSGQPQKIEAFLKSLDILLKKSGDKMVKTTYLKHNIVYNPNRQIRDPEEISAYTRLGNRLILGTGVEVVRKVIDVAEGKSVSITEDKEFIRMRTKAIEARDGFVYVSNKEARFVKTLREWEEDWHMTLFLSAESMASIGFSFDLIDEDRAKGRMVFRATKEEALPAIQDDARFLGEAIKRKFTAEKIDYTSKITTRGNYVTLDFTIWGLKPVWVKAFGEEEKVATADLSAEAQGAKAEVVPESRPAPTGQAEKSAEAREIRKEREEAKAPPKAAPERRKRPEYLPKAIFAFLLMVIVLALLILERRRRGK